MSRARQKLFETFVSSSDEMASFNLIHEVVASRKKRCYNPIDQLAGHSEWEGTQPM